ncbi:MAG: amidohydrolase [Candidatus Aenigmarchaeota archaeon]|nr:amidohydrolase [Candidatus Aenigmarchaeota archaeon]
MILLKNCKYIVTQNNKREILKNKDILIENNKIKDIGSFENADKIIDCSNKIVMPGLINCHTHAAMTLFRGYGDDMNLQEWLENKIWPIEKKLDGEKIYWGSKLAIVEMIKTGTTCFNDMYFYMDKVAQACVECNIRSVLSRGYIDNNYHKKINEMLEEINKVKELNSDLITLALGPHAIYTNSESSLKWFKEYSDKNDLLIHIHLSETKKEVEDCIKKHGKSPVKYLYDIGFLSHKVIAAHCVWLSEDDIKLLKQKNVSLVYNPASNMKLSSGIMPYHILKELNVCLGTDGAASNNNLNMFEEMKIAALLQKVNKTPILLAAQEALDMATINGAKALRINAGSIEPGKLADLIIIDLNRPDMIPLHNVVSNLVYSFDGDVDTVIINGKIVMYNKKLININEQETFDKINSFKFY